MITGEGLLQLKESAIQQIVEDYVMEKRKVLSPNSLQLPIASLQFFFSLQDKVLNWKRIKKMIPEQVKKAGYSAYQNDDIKNMLVVAWSKRNMAFIHFLASTGCRIGAIPELKIKHLLDMPDSCKAVLFYEDTNEEYYGFLTPEASKALEEYLNERRKDGEPLNENSPVFRTGYSIGFQPVKALTLRGIESLMERLVKEAENRKKINRTRCNIMSAHGFRKRFASIIKLDNKISWAVSERLLGHKCYLDESYFVPTKENLFLEFKKVIADLTISDEERVKAENLKLKKEKSELEKNKLEIKEMKKRLEDIEYNRKARDSAFACGMVNSDFKNDYTGKLLSILAHVIFEMSAPEEEKRRIWKSVPQEAEKGESLDIFSLLDPKNLSLSNYFGRPVSVQYRKVLP
jgi:integrase/recombinase XerD